MAALPYIQLYVADYLADTAHLSVTASGAYLHLIMNYWQTGKPLKNCDVRLGAIARCYNGEWSQVKDLVLEFFEDRDGLLHHPRIDSDLARVGRGGDDPELTGGWRGYVYFIATSGGGKYKIGYSKNPWARLKDLQVASSEQLLLVATVKTTDVSEKGIHAELDEYRLSGEWFSDCAIIADLISAIKSKKVTTVDESVDYLRSYSVATVVTTKDTDTDTDTDTDKSTKRVSRRFDEFWSVYPVKKGRAAAEKTWTSKNLDSIADSIIADVKQRISGDRQWIDGYIPHGSTYVNGRGWEDAIEAPRGKSAEPLPDYLVGAI